MPVMTKTPAGDDIVILSRDEYDALTAGGENAADAAVARAALDRLGWGEETLTDAELDELLAAKTSLQFWRKKRGINQADLAKAAGTSQGFISEIENGTKTGDVQTLKAIATALRVKLDDLVA